MGRFAAHVHGGRLRRRPESPLERIRADIDDLFASDRDLGDVLEEVVRSGVRLLFQTALRRAHRVPRPGALRPRRACPSGQPQRPLPDDDQDHSRPRHRRAPEAEGPDEAFAFRLLGVGVCRTNALESLVIAGFVRGLSVRDVEATLAEDLGSESTLSKSTVNRVCEAIKTEFDAWKRRDCPTSPWSTSSWTGATSATTTAPGPSRCRPPWALPPRAVLCWWAWSRTPRSPPMPGAASWRGWWPEACGRCPWPPSGCSRSVAGQPHVRWGRHHSERLPRERRDEQRHAALEEGIDHGPGTAVHPAER